MAARKTMGMQCSRFNTLTILAHIICALLLTSFIEASPVDAEAHVSRATSLELRILPLGDSITWGYKSTDGNGYRKQLVVSLNQTGADVSVVGSNKHGTMWDPWNSGYPGYTISEIQQQLAASTVYRPNIVLIHAGTNDLFPNPPRQPYAQAISRLGSLVDAVHSACPDAVILLAQIIGTKNATAQSRFDSFNQQIPGLVSQKQATGYKILTVNMQSITSAYLKDEVHPTDQGYAIMGYIWSKAVQYAQYKGLVKAPVTPDYGLNNSPSTP